MVKMFKKKCKNCKKKIKEGFQYCPSCGMNQEGKQNKVNDSGDWGLLGKDDSLLFPELKFSKGFSSFFNTLLKNFDSHVGKKDKNFSKKIRGKKNPKGFGVNISISTSGGGSSPRIDIMSFGEHSEFDQDVEDDFSEGKKKEVKPKQKNLKNFKQLPREEPPTRLRRLIDRVIYEIDLPGVSSLDNVSVNKLENSIEVRATSKKKSFFKLIPVSLPLINYKLSKGRLFLELDARE